MNYRMLQRRGTAAQWTSIDNGNGPILGSGEIGWESDTNKFKIGNGIDSWVNLPYFVDSDSVNTSLGDYVEVSTLAQPDGVATLDSNGKLESAQLPDIALVTVHAVADQSARLALSVQPGDIAIQTDNGQTYVLTATPASTNSNWTAITVADPFPTHSTSDLAEGTNLYFTDERAQDAVGGMFTGNAETGITVTYNDSTAKVDFTVADQFPSHSTSDLAEGTNLYFTDERAQDAIGNNLGTGLSYNDSTGAISVTTNTYDAYGAAAAALSSANSYTDTAVSNLVDAAPGMLDTLNELAAALGDDANFATNIANSLSLKAPLASPVFTGTVDFTSATVVGIDALPSQTGNAGKYLTTNGTMASWAEASSPTPHPFAMIG